MSDAPIPTDIQLHTQSRTLELGYGDDGKFTLSCEFLRVYSPSAEVKGHGPGQEVLQTGKINVSISEIHPVGNYAIQFVFTDGHDSGIFSWTYLFELCQNQQTYWEDYLQRLKAANATRDPAVQVVRIGN
jgi:DUF971 family protein